MPHPSLRDEWGTRLRAARAAQLKRALTNDGRSNAPRRRKKPRQAAQRRSALRKTGLTSLVANALTPRDQNLCPGFWARAGLPRCSECTTSRPRGPSRPAKPRKDAPSRRPFRQAAALTARARRITTVPAASTNNTMTTRPHSEAAGI
jgi:hypothetical protein